MSPVRAIDKQISLRPATVADTAFARAVHHAALRDVVTRQFGGWDETLQDSFFEEDWTPERFEIVLFEGVPCGYLRIELHETHIEVHEINIDPGYQQQGIGTRILMDAIAKADELGLPILLQTLHLNKAEHLYSRLGFKEIGRTGTHIKMRRDPK